MTKAFLVPKDPEFPGVPLLLTEWGWIIHSRQLPNTGGHCGLEPAFSSPGAPAGLGVSPRISGLPGERGPPMTKDSTSWHFRAHAAVRTPGSVRDAAFRAFFLPFSGGLQSPRGALSMPGDSATGICSVQALVWALPRPPLPTSSPCRWGGACPHFCLHAPVSPCPDSPEVRETRLGISLERSCFH